jgi:hypothetical protein
MMRTLEKSDEPTPVSTEKKADSPSLLEKKKGSESTVQQDIDSMSKKQTDDKGQCQGQFSRVFWP